MLTVKPCFQGAAPAVEAQKEQQQGYAFEGQLSGARKLCTCAREAVACSLGNQVLKLFQGGSQN